MASQEASSNDFGLLIAYALPGFAALYGTTYISPEARNLFAQMQADDPTLGGFLYMTVAAMAVGMTVSAGWAAVDTLHRVGIVQTIADLVRLTEK